ncbi:hypothetical protein [Clostridium sp. ZBS4]|uniref:hypothetical protein n=1 Tax=Clostridium sp. ZBS4 TaxID=2949974 RepID=UPI00207982CA|nr:hypothetical protein [Clostridium sp. ZBS4]
MENSSLKKATIHRYCCLPFTKEFENQSLTIITSAGIITGTPVIKTENDESIMLIADVNNKVSNDYRKNISIKDDYPLPGSDGFFMLKDVKLVSSSTVVSFNVLNVFYDQVIAITVTPKQ